MEVRRPSKNICNQRPTTTAVAIVVILLVDCVLGAEKNCGPSPRQVFLKRGERKQLTFWSDQQLEDPSSTEPVQGPNVPLGVKPVLDGGVDLLLQMVNGVFKGPTSSGGDLDEQDDNHPEFQGAPAVAAPPVGQDPSVDPEVQGTKLDSLPDLPPVDAAASSGGFQPEDPVTTEATATTTTFMSSPSEDKEVAEGPHTTPSFADFEVEVKEPHQQVAEVLEIVTGSPVGGSGQFEVADGQQKPSIVLPDLTIPLSEVNSGPLQDEVNMTTTTETTETTTTLLTSIVSFNPSDLNGTNGSPVIEAHPDEEVSAEGVKVEVTTEAAAEETTIDKVAADFSEAIDSTGKIEEVTTEAFAEGHFEGTSDDPLADDDSEGQPQVGGEETMTAATLSTEEESPINGTTPSPDQGLTTAKVTTIEDEVGYDDDEDPLQQDVGPEATTIADLVDDDLDSTTTSSAAAEDFGALNSTMTPELARPSPAADDPETEFDGTKASLSDEGSDPIKVEEATTSLPGTASKAPENGAVIEDATLADFLGEATRLPEEATNFEATTADSTVAPLETVTPAAISFDDDGDLPEDDNNPVRSDLEGEIGGGHDVPAAPEEPVAATTTTLGGLVAGTTTEDEVDLNGFTIYEVFTTTTTTTTTTTSAEGAGPESKVPGAAADVRFDVIYLETTTSPPLPSGNASRTTTTTTHRSLPEFEAVVAEYQRNAANLTQDVQDDDEDDLDLDPSGTTTVAAVEEDPAEVTTTLPENEAPAQPERPEVAGAVHSVSIRVKDGDDKPDVSVSNSSTTTTTTASTTSTTTPPSIVSDLLNGVVNFVSSVIINPKPTKDKTVAAGNQADSLALNEGALRTPINVHNMPRDQLVVEYFGARADDDEDDDDEKELTPVRAVVDPDGHRSGQTGRRKGPLEDKDSSSSSSLVLSLGESSKRDPINVPLPDLIGDFSLPDPLSDPLGSTSSKSTSARRSRRSSVLQRGEWIAAASQGLDEPDSEAPTDKVTRLEVKGRKNFITPWGLSGRNSQLREAIDASSGHQVTNCTWSIKTENDLYLLVTFHNLSAPFTVDCKGAYIEVERENNGFEARWCGNRVTQGGSRPHVIFARNEVRIAVYDNGAQNKDLPTGFSADVEVIDLFDGQQHSDLRKTGAYSNVRKLTG